MKLQVTWLQASLTQIFLTLLSREITRIRSLGVSSFGTSETITTQSLPRRGIYIFFKIQALTKGILLVADENTRCGTTPRLKETASGGNVATAPSTVSKCSQSCNNVCIATNITRYFTVWQALTYADHILSIVKGCKLEFRHSSWQLEVQQLSSKESIIANTDIKYFLRKWVIRKVTHESTTKYYTVHETSLLNGGDLQDAYYCPYLEWGQEVPLFWAWAWKLFCGAKVGAYG